MLKKFRIVLAILFWTGITLLLLDFTGALHGWLGWMAKVQFLPAVMALNVAVIAGLIILTLVFGRVYCSVICPLGVFQDGVAHLRVACSKRKNRKPYSYRPEIKWLRYGVWAIFVLSLAVGFNALVSILAPYSAWGRIVQNLFQPLWLWGNNLLAAISERAGSYAFYGKEVWLRSLTTLIVAVVTIAVVVFLAWCGGRTYCNTVCPVGTTLSFFPRFAMLRPVIDTAKCKNCKQCEHQCKASCINIDTHKIDYSRCVDCFNCIDTCKFGALKYRFAWGGDASAAPQQDNGKPKHDNVTLSEANGSSGRRAFLAGTALAIGTAALKAQEKKVDGGLAAVLDKEIPRRKTPITPPGSVSSKNMYNHCTACQLCVAECPNNVLRPSGSLEHFMQPESSYERGWCRPECTRCSEICPTGAIRRITREEKTAIHIGTATIQRDLCVAEEGVSCGNCARHCPSGAIRMVTMEDRGITVPTIDKEICIGCGACEYVCPARPLSAIRVEGNDVHHIR